MRGLRLECALEVGLQPAVGAPQLVDLGLQSLDARVGAVLLHLEGSDLRVARRDGGVRGGELSGDAVTVRRGTGAAAGHVRQAGGEILSLAIQCLVGGLQSGVRINDVLQLFDPSGVLLGDGALFGDLTLHRRRAAAVPADVAFGLLE